MAKTKQQKQQTIDKLSEGLKNSKSVVFANFQGLTVKQTEDSRNKCKEIGIECLASKKTLLKKATTEAGFDIDTKSFEGGVAVFMGQDEVAPAQIVAKFAKEFELAKIFGGILDGKFIETAEVKALSQLPSKEQLYAKLVGTINAPISGFVNVLAGNLRSVVNVLNAIKNKKSEA